MTYGVQRPTYQQAYFVNWNSFFFSRFKCAVQALVPKADMNISLAAPWFNQVLAKRINVYIKGFISQIQVMSNFLCPELMCNSCLDIIIFDLGLQHLIWAIIWLKWQTDFHTQLRFSEELGGLAKYTFQNLCFSEFIVYLTFSCLILSHIRHLPQFCHFMQENDGKKSKQV